MANNGAQSTSAENINNQISLCTKPKKAKKDNHWSNWLEALAHCITETPLAILDLGVRKLDIREIQSILNILPDSQVTELILDGCILTNDMAYLSPLLIQTKIRKLGIADCNVTKKDLLPFAEVLKESQIVSLHLLYNPYFIPFSSEEGLKFLSYLKESKLTILNANFNGIFSNIPRIAFFQAFLDTSITCLDLQDSQQSLKDLTFLFENLGNSLVTQLNLCKVSIISCEVLQELSRRLVETKIEKLNLGCNNLDDNGLEILARGLVNSNVTDLNLMDNEFNSLHALFSRLKESNIKTLNVCSNRKLRSGNSVGLQHSALVSLNLSGCKLTDEAGAELIENLRFSNVKKLDISSNNVGLLTVIKFCEKVRDVYLNDLDISHNPIPLEAFLTLGNCLKQSKLTRIGVNGLKHVSEAANLFIFLMLTEGSPISRVEMAHHAWNTFQFCEAKMATGTTFTELYLRGILIHNVSNIFNFLKYSAVTHLNLCKSRILDNTAVILAKCLKETQIRRLNLSYNKIGSQGAKALALSLKDSNLLYLHLEGNKINDDGLEFLAEQAEDTFVSGLDVFKNTGKKILLVETVVWHNKVSAHKLVSICKQIVPQTSDNKFRFVQSFDSSDVSAFLEKCMWFYKAVTEKPQAFTMLSEEKIVSMSRGEMMKLVLEEFPTQFSQFIGRKIKADVIQHVDVLRKAEKMGLTAVIESLLLNRPVFLLDKKLGILHPYVYMLLLKYKQPVGNLGVEPSGILKIIEYFFKHVKIDGAKEVVSLLREVNLT